MSYPNNRPTKTSPLTVIAILTTIFLMVLPVRAISDELSVTANLSPTTFSVDGGARLTITVNGSRSADLVLPKTDPNGYGIIQRGRSSQINMINGQFSSAITFTCIVQGYKPGSYTLPPITVMANDESRTTEPIDFTVTGPRQQGGSTTGDVPSGAAAAQGKNAFLQLELDRQEGYVGEIIPVRVKAYFRRGLRASLNAAPTLDGGGLIMPQLTDKPVQTEERVGDIRYTVLTWRTALSNIKEGEHGVQLHLDATLLIPERRRANSLFGRSPFPDDDFFDSFFGGYREEPVTIRSDKLTFTSLPLPEKGKPDDFTGAIGNFNLQVSATPVEAEVGEPLTLTMTITGKGNFDRVQAPRFPATDGWKIYSPSADFTAPDGSGNKGSKVFEQAIIARNSVIREIPALTFSYFDPQHKRYFTRKSLPIPVTISAPDAPPAPATSTVAGPVGAGQGPSKGRAQPADKEQVERAPAFPGLAPLHLEAGRPVAVITPLFAKPLFLVVLAALFSAFVVLTVLHLLRRHRRNHPEEERNKKRRRALGRSIAELEKALTAGDSTAFLDSCRRTIQRHLAMVWDLRAEAITGADLIARLGRDNPLVEIFFVTEQAAFSGVRPDQATMHDYLAIIKTELEKLQ